MLKEIKNLRSYFSDKAQYSQQEAGEILNAFEDWFDTTNKEVIEDRLRERIKGALEATDWSILRRDRADWNFCINFLFELFEEYKIGEKTNA